MAFVDLDGKRIALFAGEHAFAKFHHCDRIPFKPFGLVDRHEFDIGTAIGVQGGRLVFDGSQRIRPRHESAQCRRLTGRDLR